jgi:hypothetical protein
MWLAVTKPDCLLCGSRKAKRACPALGRDICPVCCATKRRTEIACPDDCGYLSISRAHPAAAIQRQQERDMRFVVPRIAHLGESQYRLFLYSVALLLQQARSVVPSPLDADVADAAASVAATLETAGKGIIYEHRPASLPAQRLASELGTAIAELAKKAGAETARLERDLAVALRALERAAREAKQEAADAANADASWLALANRMMGAAQAAPAEKPADAPRIII